MKPPFTYFGGKTRIAGQITALLPPHEHYVEPFAGSLSVLLAKPRSAMETVSDLDGGIVTFWRVLRERPAEFERACFLTPHARAEHQAAFDPADDELERARRLWVLLTQGRSGQRRATGWRHYQDPRGSTHSMPDYLAAYAGRLAAAATRIAGVSLECLPALELVRRYGRHRDCLLYVDPPYLDSVRHSAGRGNSYLHEMRTEADHRELADALLKCRGGVVLSGYSSPLYDVLYDGWHRAGIAGYTGNAHTGKAQRAEVLWSNRAVPCRTTGPVRRSGGIVKTATATEWGVRVNEVGIFSIRLGAEWWVTALTPWVLNGRALCLGMCPAGGVWFLPGGAKDDAEFMRDHIVSHGVHPRCVTVTTRAKADAERSSHLATVPDLEAS